MTTANHGMQRSGGGEVLGEIKVNFRRPLIPDVIPRWLRERSRMSCRVGLGITLVVATEVLRSGVPKLVIPNVR